MARATARKQVEQPSEGANFLAKLIGAILSLSLVLLAVFVIVPTVVGNMSINMAMSTASNYLTPNSSWKLETSEKTDAGFFCKVEDNCPQLKVSYVTNKDVSMEQLESFLPGKVKHQGDCKPPKKKGMNLCSATSSNASFQYSAKVSSHATEEKKSVIDIIALPAQSLSGK